MVYRRGQVSCYCNACTSEIPSLEAIVSYLTSSPPKWVPKTRREIVCTQSLHSQDQSTAICNRDPDCDSSSSRGRCTPPARFHAAVFFSLLFGWAGSWQGEEWSETNIEPSVRLTLFDLCATTAVAPYRLLKSDARRMQLLRVETYLHAWTLLSWSCTAVGLAGWHDFAACLRYFL